MLIVKGGGSNHFEARDLLPCKGSECEKFPSKVFKICLNKEKLPRLTKSETKFSLEITGSRFYVSGDKNLSGNPDTRSCEFYITKDIHPSALLVQITDFEGAGQNVENGSIIDLSEYSFLLNSKLKSKEVTLLLSNVAKEAIIGGAGVMVSDVNVYEEGTSDKCLINEEGALINNVIKYEITGLDDKGTVFLSDGGGRSVKVSMQFDPSAITSTRSGECAFSIKTRIVFQYWENSEGASQDQYGDRKRQGDVIVIWHLKVLPHEEWLCIDYGSSAIVCSYGKQTVHDDKAPLLKLRARKQRLYKGDDAFKEKFSEDDAEDGLYFLNSDIILYGRTAVGGAEYSSLCSEQPREMVLPYHSQAVLLSPTPSLVRAWYQFLLPCMKILVGNTYLPKDQYGLFAYFRKSADKGIEYVKAGDVTDDVNCLLRVDAVLKESYHVLFRYFISPLIGDISRVNKIALTYPNTYTPVHLKLLGTIAKWAFPNLLRFNPVAESDAVAAYYVKHWSDYHGSLDGDKQKEEYALVYDMGAGTLDLTYFIKKWDEATKMYDVEVKGKIGTGKAGNYLDYVIAEIVVRYMGLDSGLTNLNVKGDANLHSLRIDLKRIVKDEIKPKLGKEGCEIEFKFNGGKYKINTLEIINDDSFSEFIKEITTNIIRKVANYLGKNKPIINTVIMSGRSCKLPIIKEKIKEAVRGIARPNDITYVSLDTPVSDKGKNKLKSYDADLQKTVVVEGAAILSCLSEQEDKSVKFIVRRLYSSYGIFYKDYANNQLRYEELISHNDILFDSNDTIKSKTINIAVGSPTILLVQTYLSAEDTEKCYKENNCEFISEMSEFSTAGCNNSQLRLSLEIDADNTVILYVGNSQAQGETPKGYNLKSAVMRRSLWPLVFRLPKKDIS